jgi:hypothetical protein
VGFILGLPALLTALTPMLCAALVGDGADQ